MKTVIENVSIEAPQKPTFLEMKAEMDWDFSASIILSLLAFAFYGITGWTLLLLGFIILFVVGFILLCNSLINYNKGKKAVIRINQESREQYEKDCKEYPLLLEKYHKELDAVNVINEKELEIYEKNLASYNEHYAEMMEKHHFALGSLEGALEKAYNENIIFSKYRNIVAITSINEYLVSGRCDKLEGADGAYNLYELEMRQNIIIDQLSTIIRNLEQIKSNQYSLYQQLQKSNNTINEILNEVRQVNINTKLTAYFSYVTALVESSSKYY